MEYDELLHQRVYKSKKARMSKSQRAKIFLPFAALKGFEEEIEKVDKNNINSDSKE